LTQKEIKSSKKILQKTKMINCLPVKLFYEIDADGNYFGNAFESKEFALWSKIKQRVEECDVEDGQLRARAIFAFF
jgi:hypothetical protein